MGFAMIETTAIVATLLQHADFEPVEGEEPYPVAKVTLVPRGGMRLRVSLRSHADIERAAALAH
jgi:cytochrome P450